jgi:hypothetical protein
MDTPDYDTHYFRYCRRLDGSLEPIDLAKRNQRRVPRFHPSVIEAPESEPEESAEYRELVEEVSQNLNAVERRTWLKIIDGRSTLDIAAEDGVSRAAVYCRLKAMVRKNAYVAIWWRLKKKKNQHE